MTTTRARGSSTQKGDQGKRSKKMHDVEVQRSPLACDLAGFDDESRRCRSELVKKMQTGLQEMWELPDGYGMALDPGSSMLVDMVELIVLERLCCPFLKFELTVPEENGPIRLKITGREGAKKFLAEEFGVIVGINKV